MEKIDVILAQRRLQSFGNIQGSNSGIQRFLMINLIGDEVNDWKSYLDEGQSVRLHLYGKRDTRPGRKMGHFCVLDPVLETALEKAETLFKQLMPR